MHAATMTVRKQRWIIILTVALFALLLGGFAAFQLAIHSLKGQVEKALGPQGEVKEIRVSLTGVEIIGLRIKAPPAETPTAKQTLWPAADQLRAERILIAPSFADLFTGRVALRVLRIEGAYIAMLRTRDRRMSVLPGLLEPQPTPPASNSKEKPSPSTSPTLTIGRIELVEGIIEFFDATVRTPPHKLRLEQINASIDKLSLPDLKGFSTVNLVGTLKGVRQDGKITISGTAEFASKESGITTRLRSVDLVALQPYLLKATESGIKKGTLDLDLNSSVKKSLLHAPGTLTLKDLELTSASGTLMGMPRNAVIAMMKNRDGKISLKFVLEGNINDPQFSLNENLSRRLSSSMANSLGISVESLAKGVGNVGSSTAKGISESIGKLIGK